MPTDLICPDCGGVVGATQTTEAGPPCRCFTADAPSAAAATAIASLPAGSKVCRICGRDITNSTRYKDSMGYMCHACHVIDKEKVKPAGVKCHDCGRVVQESALNEYHGVKICFKCREDRVEKAAREQKYHTVADSKFKEHDKKNLLIILGVLGLLVGLILLHKVFKLI